MRAQLSDRDYEQLSAYIDGQLSPQEQHRLEERLHARPELQDALNEISRMRSLLRTAPRRKAPRNFTLTPEMVGQRAPRRRGMSWNLFPAMSFASALAAFALIASLVFELIPGQPLSRSTAQQPQYDTTAAGSAPAEKLITTPKVEQPALPMAAPVTNATSPASPAATPVAPSVAAGAQPAQDQSQFGPPVISWNGSPAFSQAAGPGVGMGGGGGGGGGAPNIGPLLGPPQAPSTVYGVGGGAGGAGVASEPSGQIVVPQEGMNSLEAQNAAPTTPAQPNPDIHGTGPILGVPQSSEGGQIIEEKSIIGQPDQNGARAVQQPTAQPTAGPLPSAPDESQPQPEQPARSLLGLPALAFVQVLLALITIATGVTAFLLYRKSNG